MTGNGNQDPVVVDQGVQGQPSPDASGNPPAVNSGKQEGAFVFKSKEEFEKAVQEIAGRAAQSTKDRRIARLENQVLGFQEQLAVVDRYKELTSSGMSEREARMQMQLDALTQGNQQANSVQPTTTPNQVVGSQNNSASAVNPVLSALGINPNDADYLQAQANGKIADFIKNKLRPAPQSVVSQPSGGQIPASNQDDAEVLKEQLQAEMQKPRSTRDRKKVAELKTKLVEATRRS